MKCNETMKRTVLAVMMTALMLSDVWSENGRSIVSVECVSVEVAVGNAPRLPYRLWVRYGDGYGEYRQVRWQNSSEARM